MKIGSMTFVTREYKWKPQNTTTHLLEWLNSERPNIPHVGEDVEEVEPSYIAGRSKTVWPLWETVW